MSIIRRLILPALFLSCLFSLPVLAQVSAAIIRTRHQTDPAQSCQGRYL